MELAASVDIPPTTFVLVHGAWHGGWSWKHVAALLRSAGHEVHSPTLTGLAERSHLYSDDIDLGTHIDDVVNEILWNDLVDIVLCGHSYGGMVVTGVAERLPDRVRSIVYLDAFVPEDGQSLNDISGGDHPAVGGVPPIPLEAFGLGPEHSAWATPKLTPHPPRTFSERLKVTGAFERIPVKVYVQATLGSPPFFATAYEKALASPDWIAAQIECGHEVPIERPEEVAELLLVAAR